ncbi:MAG: hypothetical protein COA70_04955 [Planctomycetota bacterium]|nr:MAG: hypothetical protein COA70_04955 [Planctomycetota bacterium]
MSDSPANALKAFQALDRADQELALELVSCSGSLKELAKRRSVSYPTIRQRLDRLIARLEAAQSEQPLDPMAEHLADLVERGEMTLGGAKAALLVHRELLQTQTRKSS